MKEKTKYILTIDETTSKDINNALNLGREVEISSVAVLRKVKVNGPIKTPRLVARTIK